MAREDTAVRDELLKLLDEAIRMSDERLARVPDYRELEQVRAQLDEVRRDVRRGGRPSPDLQRRIVFGRFAVRELEDIDLEYARVLARTAHLYSERL